MRISLADVLEYLASGMSPDEVLSDFSDLTREDVSFIGPRASCALLIMSAQDARGPEERDASHYSFL